MTNYTANYMEINVNDLPFYSLLFEAAVGGVGLAGVDVNNEDGCVANLVLNAIVVNK